MVKGFVALLIAFTVVAVQGETFQTEDQFSISLPEDWIEIPKPMLDTYVDNVDQQTTDVPTQYYDYGYQLMDSTWLTYPYILVEVLPYGRLPSGELKRLAMSEEGVGEVSDEGFDAMFSKVTNGTRTYDSEHQMLWTTLAIENAGGTPIKALVGVKLTEVGLIRLTGCATTATFDLYAGIFREAFSNLDVDEAIRYKPGLTDESPVMGRINVYRILLWCVGAVVFGGAFWLIKIGIVRMIQSRRSEAD